LSNVNKHLENEITILRHTTEFLREQPLLDTFEYQAYFAKQVSKELPISSFSEEELILEFSNFISNQKTDKAIEILKPMVTNHFYRLSKMPIKA